MSEADSHAEGADSSTKESNHDERPTPRCADRLALIGSSQRLQIRCDQTGRPSRLERQRSNERILAFRNPADADVIHAARTDAHSHPPRSLPAGPKTLGQRFTRACGSRPAGAHRSRRGLDDAPGRDRSPVTHDPARPR